MAAASSAGTTLRLVWPQWQGAGRDMVAQLTPGIPMDQARHGYVTGTAVLQAGCPPRWSYGDRPGCVRRQRN
jgi:arginase